MSIGARAVGARRCLAAAAASADRADNNPEELLAFLEELHHPDLAVADGPQRLEAAGAALTSALISAEPRKLRLKLLRAVANLGAMPGRPYRVGDALLTFLESFTEDLEVLRDGETITARAASLREVLYCFHLANLSAERLRLIYEHIQRDFPQFEAAGALLPMPDAVRLCHTMLGTELSAAPAVVVLLRCALREPLMHYEDTATELRMLKMIELLLRVDFLHTQEQLPKDVAEYLSVVRSLRYYDPEIRRDTALSYQLAFFLRKHGFPAKRHMLGPYALKVCDPEARLSVEPLQARSFRSTMRETPAARKIRHLEAVGWRSISVHEEDWSALDGYAGKAAYVRSMLKENGLLEL